MHKQMLDFWTLVNKKLQIAAAAAVDRQIVQHLHSFIDLSQAVMAELLYM